MSARLDELQKVADWQNRYLGKQDMQLAVLRWAMANREVLRSSGLADSLVAALDAEIALHRAARPQRSA